MKIGRYLKAVFALFMVCILTFSVSGCTKANKEKEFYDLKYVWSCDELTIDLTQYDQIQADKYFFNDKIQHEQGTFPFVLQLDGEEKLEGVAFHSLDGIILLSESEGENPQSLKYYWIKLDLIVAYSEKMQDYYLVACIYENYYEGKHSGKVLILTHE